MTVESTELAPADTGRRVTLSFARKPVDPSDCFLFHKTTNRAVYDDAMAQRTGGDDVILWNKRGEITETCTANIVALLRGRLVTPPVTCGLLAGTFRERLLRRGEISERVLAKKDLLAAEKIWVVNSVRKWRRGTLL